MRGIVELGQAVDVQHRVGLIVVHLLDRDDGHQWDR